MPQIAADVGAMAREQIQSELRAGAGVGNERAPLDFVRELHDGAKQ